MRCKAIEPISIDSQDVALMKFAREFNGLRPMNPSASEWGSLVKLVRCNLLDCWDQEMRAIVQLTLEDDGQYTSTATRMRGPVNYRLTLHGSVFFSKFAGYLQDVKTRSPAARTHTVAVEMEKKVYVVDIV